ncbi:MAG: YihY/virulence factor BrkB family protein [Pseudonocardia sp.]
MTIRARAARIGRRVVRAVRAGLRVLVDDQLVDRAAALTYFGLLGIFPALIVLVGVIGVAGHSDVVADLVVDVVVDLLPAGADGVGPALREAMQAGEEAGAFAGLGVVVSVWAVSGYVAAFQRAVSAIRGAPEVRSPWSAKFARLPLTLLLLAMLTVITLVLLASGPIGAAVERAVGASATAAGAWQVLRWPMLFVVLNVFFSLLQRGLPASVADARRGRSWVSRGGVAGISLWLAGSAAFSWYVSTFATDHGSYGALGTVVAFLGWLWLGSFALLVGVEIDVRLGEPGRPG